MNQLEFQHIKGWNTLFIPKPGAQTLNIRAIVNTGSVMERMPSEYGVAHFLEHMFFKGTETRSYTEINRKFAELGDVNAYTSRQRTVYHLTTLPTKADQASELFFDLFFRARMPAEEVEKERGVILEELQTSEDNPISWAMKRIGWDTFGDDAHPVIGTPESVSSIGIEDLWRFRRRWYTPENTLFAITGDIAKTQAYSLFEKYVMPWVSLPDHPAAGHPILSPGFKREPFQIDNPKSKQSLLLLFFPSVSEIESRQLRFAPDLVANLIGGGMHSVLFERIREQLGLCYSIWMQYQTLGEKGYHTTFTLLDRNKVNLAYNEIIAEIRKLSESIPEDLLETARSNLLFDFSRGLETASGTAHMADSYFEMGRDIVPFEEYQESIRSLTSRDVQAFIRNYLHFHKVAVMNADLPTGET